MDYTSLQEAEKEYNRKLEIDFVNMLKRTVRHPGPDELRKRLVKFLRNNAIGTLATCWENLPRATPVRYKSHDVDIYILTEGGGKIFNIRRNPSGVLQRARPLCRVYHLPLRSAVGPGLYHRAA